MPSRRRSRILPRIAMVVEILNVCDRLLAAAVNGVYQGIIITVLAALSLRALSRTNAATRHAVWLCTMVLLVSLIVAHGFVGSRLRAVQPKEVAGMVATPKQWIGRDSLSSSPMIPPSDEANP